MAELIKSTALLLFTPECLEEYFTEFNFFDVGCFKATLSRGLGIGIIAGSLLVKLPQIMKILSNKSGEGINIISVLLDLFAITATAAYSFVSGFPFSSWGDGVFLGLQTAAIAALVLFYGGTTQMASAFIASYAGIVYALISGMTPVNVLRIFQAMNVPVILVGKFIQAYTNYNNGNTGQLSAATCIALFLGSSARIFTSIQETGDSNMIIMYICATIANGVIVTQLLYYWNASAKDAAKLQKND